MRLQQPLYVDKPVASIRLRIAARDVPTSASVTVTDIQLQPGELPTGIVPNPAEVGTTRGRAQYRNGVVNNKMRLVAMSNADKAAPVKMTVRNAAGKTRVGAYRFGTVNGTATADGPRNTATHGHGRAPVITERQDLHLRAEATGRVHLRLAWNERA